MITYKFRLYPNKDQQKKLWLHANRLNSLYNDFLSQKIETYEKNGESLSRFSLQKRLPILKKECSILKEINAQVVQQVPKREYLCNCGYKEDRDVNAAKNILCLGQAVLLGECSVEETIQEVLCLN